MGDLNNMTSMYGLTMSDHMSAQQMMFNQQMQMIKGRPVENSAPASAPQKTYQGFNIQDSLAVSSPSVFDLQNSPFANNSNMTQFFGNFYRNIQNKIMQTLTEYNQKIQQQSQERVNQASSEDADSGEAKTLNYTKLTQADYSQAKILTSNFNIYQIKAALDQEVSRAKQANEQMTKYLKNISPERKGVLKPLLKSEELKRHKPLTDIEISQIIIDAKETTPTEKALAINFLESTFKVQSLEAEYNQKVTQQKKAGINQPSNQQQSQERLNQAVADLNNANNERQGIENQISQLESEIRGFKEAAQQSDSINSALSYKPMLRKGGQILELKEKLALAIKKAKDAEMRYYKEIPNMNNNVV